MVPNRHYFTCILFIATLYTNEMMTIQLLSCKPCVPELYPPPASHRYVLNIGVVIWDLAVFEPGKHNLSDCIYFWNKQTKKLKEKNHLLLHWDPSVQLNIKARRVSPEHIYSRFCYVYGLMMFDYRITVISFLMLSSLKRKPDITINVRITTQIN